MQLGFTVLLSSTNLRRRKLRSFLTIGGMAVGISLIVFLVSIGFGLQRLVRSQIANVEALTILDVSKGESTLLQLNDEVVDDFKNLENVKDVSPSLSLSGQITNGASVTDVAIYGTDPKFLSYEGVKISYGNGFSGEDKPEIVLTKTALSLIGFETPQESIDQKMNLRLLVPKKIEGSTEEELVPTDVLVTVAGAINEDKELSLAYVPLEYLKSLGYKPDYSAARVKVNDGEDAEYNVARIKVEDEAALPQVRQQIESMGYQVDSVADTVGQIDKIFVVFELIVAGFGAIAMFVAAIGALNTLTVSLLERTREIGLMKTLGATAVDIYRLFLVEAIVIGMTGGLIGIGLGWLAGQGLNYLMKYLANRLGGDPVEIFYTPFIFVLLIAAIIFIISVITGVYPARRAAKINALDALRYE
ncbi:MAG: ABC transporter permease [Patescibacteria group bacterium]